MKTERTERTEDGGRRTRAWGGETSGRESTERNRERERDYDSKPVDGICLHLV